MPHPHSGNVELGRNFSCVHAWLERKGITCVYRTYQPGPEQDLRISKFWASAELDQEGRPIIRISRLGGFSVIEGEAARIRPCCWGHERNPDPIADYCLALVRAMSGRRSGVWAENAAAYTRREAREALMNRWSGLAALCFSVLLVGLAIHFWAVAFFVLLAVFILARLTGTLWRPGSLMVERISALFTCWRRRR